MKQSWKNLDLVFLRICTMIFSTDKTFKININVYHSKMEVTKYNLVWGNYFIHLFSPALLDEPLLFSKLNIKCNLIEINSHNIKNDNIFNEVKILQSLLEGIIKKVCLSCVVLKDPLNRCRKKIWIYIYSQTRSISTRMNRWYDS